MTVNIACVSIITSLFPFKGTMACFLTSFINPLNPKSDQHLISPNNITPESHIQGHKNKGNDQWGRLNLLIGK